MKVSEEGRYIRLELDIWYQEDDGDIHITSNDPDVRNFHTTVNNRVGSKRCHDNLFSRLARILVAHGKPAPELEVT